MKRAAENQLDRSNPSGSPKEEGQLAITTTARTIQVGEPAPQLPGDVIQRILGLLDLDAVAIRNFTSVNRGTWEASEPFRADFGSYMRFESRTRKLRYAIFERNLDNLGHRHPHEAWRRELDRALVALTQVVDPLRIVLLNSITKGLDMVAGDPDRWAQAFKAVLQHVPYADCKPGSPEHFTRQSLLRDLASQVGKLGEQGLMPLHLQLLCASGLEEFPRAMEQRRCGGLEAARVLAENGEPPSPQAISAAVTEVLDALYLFTADEALSMVELVLDEPKRRGETPGLQLLEDVCDSVESLGNHAGKAACAQRAMTAVLADRDVAALPEPLLLCATWLIDHAPAPEQEALFLRACGQLGNASSATRSAHFACACKTALEAVREVPDGWMPAFLEGFDRWHESNQCSATGLRHFAACMRFVPPPLRIQFIADLVGEFEAMRTVAVLRAEDDVLIALNSTLLVLMDQVAKLDPPSHRTHLARRIIAPVMWCAEGGPLPVYQMQEKLGALVEHLPSQDRADFFNDIQKKWMPPRGIGRELRRFEIEIALAKSLAWLEPVDRLAWVELHALDDRVTSEFKGPPQVIETLILPGLGRWLVLVGYIARAYAFMPIAKRDEGWMAARHNERAVAGILSAIERVHRDFIDVSEGPGAGIYTVKSWTRREKRIRDFALLPGVFARCLHHLPDALQRDHIQRLFDTMRAVLALADTRVAAHVLHDLLWGCAGLPSAANRAVAAELVVDVAALDPLKFLNKGLLRDLNTMIAGLDGRQADPILHKLVELEGWLRVLRESSGTSSSSLSENRA